MKHLLITLTLCTAGLLTACGKPERSVESNVLDSFFVILNAAEAYDRVCNQPPRLVMSNMNPETANWMGNMQVIVARIGAEMETNAEDVDADEAAERLKKTGDEIAAKVTEDIKRDGCSSAKGQRAADAFKVITTSPPAATSAAIDERIAAERGE